MFKLPISIVKNIISILPLLMVVACGDSTSIKNLDMKPRSEMVTLAGAPAVASNSLSFPGVRADYRMTTTIEGVLVSNKTGSNADQLVDSKVDLIVFKDISINLRIAKLSAEIPSKDLISITELYIAYFNRVPDANGLTYWINEFKRGMSLDQMGESFYSAGLRYSLQTQYSADMSNVDFVKIIYKNVLGRTTPDQAGLDYWSNALSSGKETRGTLVRTMLASAHTYQGDATYGWVAQLLDNKYAVANEFSVKQGISYVSDIESITQGIAIAAFVTPSDTSAAKEKIELLIGLKPPVLTTGSFPILFATQVPVSGFTLRTSSFGNHSGTIQSAPRGGDLMIRYPDGTLRNLTKEAGYGAIGFQGNTAIAVREPSVHWSGSKALFSMIIGSTEKRYEWDNYVWQIYEISGLEQGAKAVITKVPRQPATFNNISPIYGSDERVIFTSDRPRNGEPHLYPQLDEYESAPTVTGIWSLNSSTGDLRLLNHAISGAFSPSIDSFGRLIFTRWDHLQQDQQADADRADPTNRPYGAFSYADESATAARLPLQKEIFPEPRLDTHPDNIANQANGHTFNLFMPWQLNEDGTGEETLNHVGRQEFAGTYMAPSFKNDTSLSYYSNERLYLNRLYFSGSSGVFHLREDPLQPGVYYGTRAAEFGTANANQLIRFNGSPKLHAEAMAITAVTHNSTAGVTEEGKLPTAEHSGLYRNPLPMSDGSLVAVHTVETRADKNEGTREAPQYRYQFRLKTLKPAGSVFTADKLLTAGIRKSIWYYDPDVRVDFDGILWELDPVEVAPRNRPYSPVPVANTLESPEQAVLQEEGINEAQLRAWLVSNDLALIVTRNNTSRDQGDKQQPFNLRVPGGVSKKGDAGKIYDISHLQLFQADQVRGYGGETAPRPGRRPIAQLLHEPKAKNPITANAPASSVKLGLDGSSAAFVPARRAMTWQLTDGNGKPVVRERNWITFQPGEIRTCASCHGLNTKDQAGLLTPMNKPEALRALMQYWKLLPK